MRSASGWHPTQPAVDWCSGVGSRLAPRSCPGPVALQDRRCRHCVRLSSPEFRWEGRPASCDAVSCWTFSSSEPASSIPFSVVLDRWPELLSPASPVQLWVRRLVAKVPREQCSERNPEQGSTAPRPAAGSPGSVADVVPVASPPLSTEPSMHKVREPRPEKCSCEVGCYEPAVRLAGNSTFRRSIRAFSLSEFIGLSQCLPLTLESRLRAGCSRGPAPGAGADEKSCPALPPTRSRPSHNATAGSGRSAPARSRCLLSWS